MSSNTTDIINKVSHPYELAKTRWLSLLSKYTPHVFYDIGANNPYEPMYGALSYFRDMMPCTDIYLFEPSDKHRVPLMLSGLPFDMSVLSNKAGIDVDFYESNIPNNDGGGDGYYKENTDAYDKANLNVVKKVTNTLDNIINTRKWPLPDIIKLDTQGSELDILTGSPKCLAHAKFIVIECALLNYNKDAPLIDEVIAFMTNAGYTMYDIIQMHYHKHVLNQVDVVFINGKLDITTL